MELFSTDTHFVLVNGPRTLCINRHTSQVYSRLGIVHELGGASCLGLVYGFIGKIQFDQNSEPRLVFIRERVLVGKLRGCEIYRIKSVIAIPLEGGDDILLEPCTSHYSKREDNTATLVKVRPTTQVPDNLQSSPKKDEKVERRMLDEFHKMFYESESFYYSNDYDLTNTVQRLALNSEKTTAKEKLPLWYGVDPRFFWNQYMLFDIIQAQDSVEPCWIVPIIQGFVQSQHCALDHLLDPVGPALINIHGDVDIWLISRRCRYRAGTRYLKRGIDETGNVANYVETEQIMIFKKHLISFVLTRGSVPLYWTQPGVKYRPPFQLQKTGDENYSSFRRHIEEQGSIYGPLVIVNLVDKSGKEKVLGDAFLEIILRHNSPDVSYFTFDFHDNCRGSRFGNVQILIDKLNEQLKSINYCWIDSYGIVQTQTGVLRVNCVDCLDRTNVVQSLIARHVLCSQMCKLGLVSPEFGLPNSLKKALQHLWANNGDIISKQYAGTSALKGDYTRTGERRIAGALKDGMNSANRYYLNRFRDSTRQAVIDVMLGVKKYVTEEEFENEKSIEDRETTAEQLKGVIEDTQKCIIPKFDIVLGSWGLVNARENDPSAVDVDTVLILTESSYYVTGYDCLIDSITTTERVKLAAITLIELGNELTTQSPGIFGIFGNSTSHKASIQVPTLRISYTTSGTGRYHQFRSSNMRFFNNICVPIHQPEEMFQALSVIAETIQIAARTQGNRAEINQVGKLVPLPVKSESKDLSLTSQVVSSGNVNSNLEERSKSSKLLKLEKSFERFTPKYFRASSLADARRREEADPGAGVNITDVKVLKTLPEETKDNDPLQEIISLDLIRPELLVRSSSTSNSRQNDLILSSCGLVAIPVLTLQRPNCPFSPSFSTHLQLPYEDRPQPPSNFPSLQHHRCSLPTSALLLEFPARSPITPEITVTESRGSVAPTYLHLGVIPLRLTKSSEDVKVIQDSTLRTHPTTTTHLRPISSEGRSTSDQDISTILANSLKGSHSESSIKGVVQPVDPLSVKGNLQMKRDAVLAPFGKLAGYFTPKKIKDSFRTQIQRKDGDGLRSSEDTEQIRVLEERKVQCKSLIVDVQGIQVARR